jgi:hypothetical protein
MHNSLKIAVAFLVTIGMTGIAGVANAGQSPATSSVAISGVSSKAPKNSSQTFSGTGDDVIDVLPISESVLIAVTHDGDSYFSVKSKTADDDYLDLVVSHIGPYSGTRLQELGSSYSGKKVLGLLDVSAEGNWTIEIKPLSKATSWNGKKTLTGTGDAVIKVPAGTKAGNKLVMTHAGENYFSVKTYTSKGKYDSLKVTTVGTYSGKKTFGSKAKFIVVSGTDEWTLKRKK